MMLNKKRTILILLFSFFVSVIVRLPNFQRPLSKHHEYLPAIVLINTVSWMQAGGGSLFYYTPITNFQNEGDKMPINVPLTRDGNNTYLSLGSGWYVIPYFFFKTFQLSPSVGGLRALNLFFGLVTILLVFLLYESTIAEVSKNRYLTILSGCLVMFFSPGVLWYSGNVYTHSFVMLPFVISATMVLLPMLQLPEKINIWRLTLLFFLFFLGVYMDWFSLFVGTYAMIAASLKIKKDSRYIFLIAAIGASLVAGLGFVLWQFGSYLTAKSVIQFWIYRYNFDVNLPISKKLMYLISHYFTAYFPLLFGLLSLLVVGRKYLNKSLFRDKEALFVLIWLPAVLTYHLAFFHWSYVHEFAHLPAVVLMSFVFVKLYGKLIQNLKFNVALVPFAIVLVSIVQYYYINPPGKQSLTGMPYDTYKKLGENLRDVDKQHKIFMYKPEANPMIEYYAGRNTTNATDTVQAKVFMKEWGLKEAVWVEQENFVFKEILQLKIE